MRASPKTHNQLKVLVMSLKEFFFGKIPLLVAKSLREEPGRWKSDDTFPTTYVLHRDDGMTVWVANSVYGIEVTARSGRSWGGVTGWSSFGLSPGHWLIALAADPLRRKKPTARDFAADFA